MVIANQADSQTDGKGSPLSRGAAENGPPCWGLGAPGDPNRPVLMETRLNAGDNYPPRWYGDWHAVFVLEGSVQVAGALLEVGAVLVIQPERETGPWVPGPSGVRLLEFARTPEGVTPIYFCGHCSDPDYKDVLARTSGVIYADAHTG